jgi:hypothetical protein
VIRLVPKVSPLQTEKVLVLTGCWLVLVFVVDGEGGEVERVNLHSRRLLTIIIIVRSICPVLLSRAQRRRFHKIQSHDAWTTGGAESDSTKFSRGEDPACRFTAPPLSNFTRVMVSQKSVRKTIARAVRTADLTTVSAKQIRRNVELELGLGRDELASQEWKAFVKTVIEETMAAIERGEGEEESEEEEARMLAFLRGS